MKSTFFKTINETAKMGIISGYALRQMQKAGTLPCIYSGNRCLVNIPALLKLLNVEVVPEE